MPMSIPQKVPPTAPALIPPIGFPLTVMILTFFVVRIAPVRSRGRPRPLDRAAIVVMVAVVAVAVMVVGIVSGPLMPLLAPAVVHVGMLTVVVTDMLHVAVTTASVPSVTVGMSSRYVEAKDRQNDHPCRKGDQLSAFHGIHDSFPFIRVCNARPLNAIMSIGFHKKNETGPLFNSEQAA